MGLLDKQALIESLDAAEPSERLFVTPLLDRDEQIGPGSIDVRLDSSFIILERSWRGGIDPLDEAPAPTSRSYSRLTVPFGRGIWLHPGETILGGTLEFIKVPLSLSAYVVGRSTWGRLGLIVATAIMVHPGYSGGLTLELVNHSSTPLKLYPGLRIAQLAIHRADAGTPPAADAQSSSPTVRISAQPSQYSGATRAQPPGTAWSEDEMNRIRYIGKRLVP